MAGPSVKERTSGGPAQTTEPMQGKRRSSESQIHGAAVNDRDQAAPSGLGRVLAKVWKVATSLGRRRRRPELIASSHPPTRDVVPLGSRVVVVEDRGRGEQSLLF